MTVLHGNYLNASSVKVAARSYTSTVTRGMSGTGLQEKQEIMVNSTVSYETQVTTDHIATTLFSSILFWL